MYSITYLKSYFSTWMLRRNPHIRDFYMQHIRNRYVRFQAKKELSQWDRLNLSMLSADQVSTEIAKNLKNKTPYTAAKIGSNEYFLLHWLMGENISNSRFDALHDSAGLFPNDKKFYLKYAELFAESLKTIDLLGLWTGKGEPDFYKKMGLSCYITNFENFAGDFDNAGKALNSYWFNEMKGYKVFVISSFANLINERANKTNWNQYWNGRIPWPEPEFIHAVPFPYGFDPLTQLRYKDSIELLYRFKEEHQIAMENSDLILVGCGAYALPILAWVKEHNKVAIHLGGTIQLLFGIKGGRWDTFADLYNEHWIRPGAEHTPESAKTVENSCYW
jgi:hypothetical protein